MTGRAVMNVHVSSIAEPRGPAFIGWVRAWPFGLNEGEARDACVLHKPAVIVGNLELRTLM